MTSVLCVGIAVLDYVFAVGAMPARPEKYRAKDLAVIGGGIAANAAVAVARLGGKALLATRLGTDATGDAIVAELEREGVDCSPTLRFDGLRSPTSAVLIDEAGERLVVSYSDPQIPSDPAALPTKLPAGTRAVLHSRSGGSQDDIRRTFTLADTPALGAFANEEARGSWTLAVVDRAARDTGRLERWALELSLATVHRFHTASDGVRGELLGASPRRT